MPASEGRSKIGEEKDGEQGGEGRGRGRGREGKLRDVLDGSLTGRGSLVRECAPSSGERKQSDAVMKGCVAPGPDSDAARRWKSEAGAGSE